MLSRYRISRLVLGVTLGMAFFGCVGLPRRRPPVENSSATAAAQNRKSKDVAPVPPLRIPADPIPVAETTTTTRTVPTQLTSERRSNAPPAPTTVPPSPLTPTAPPAPTSPAGEPTGDENLNALKRLHAEASHRHDTMNSYIVRMTRREVVNGKKTPEEIMLFKYRKQPKSVYFKWIGNHGEGREAVYVDGKYDGKLHTLTAAGDIPFTAAGKRISLSPDSMLVRSNSRHSITQAGVGTLLDRFALLIAAIEKGDNSQGTLTYQGKVKRAEFHEAVEGVEWKIPPKVDPTLPRGGRRWCYCDPECKLPSLIITHDERGQEVEYYRYDRFLFPTNLDEADFNPDVLWGKLK